MTLNAGIILAGQQPDILGALRQGTEAGMLANQATKQNALTSLYAQDGAGIVAGDAGAINRLAGLDPMAALGVQGAQLDMQATQGRMTALANEDKRRIAELAASKSAEEAAKIAADMEQDLQVLAAVTDPAQWDQVAIARGLPELAGKFDQRAPILAQSAEAFTAFQEGMKPKDPADEYGRYAAEEIAEGREPLSRIDYKRAGSPSSVVRVGPNGTEVVTGVGAAGAANPDRISISPIDVTTVLSSIDEIAGDENLPRVLGPLEGGGGNDVEQLSPMRRAYYGSGGLSLIEKISQLQGATWFAARELLKGGGQITDYESRKAEAAMARLSRVKDPAEFKAALKDLRDAIEEGQRKLQAAQGGGTPDAAPAETPQMPEAGGLSPEAQEALRLYGSP